MKPITVGELMLRCYELVKKGYENRVIQITSDDEGNEYHTLFYQFTSDDEEIQDVIDAGLLHDDNFKADEIVLLG